MLQVQSTCTVAPNAISEPSNSAGSVQVISARQLNVENRSARECIGYRNMKLVCSSLSEEKVFVCTSNWHTGATGYWNQSVSDLQERVHNATIRTCGECAKTIEFYIVGYSHVVDAIPSNVIEN